MARLNTSLHPKLTESTISILHNKKINTVFDLVLEDSEKIMQYSGLTYQETLDLKKNITKLFIGGIKKGSELLNSSRNNIVRTDIKCLDNLLKGGLSGGEIYEICGLSSSGKSQLCHTFAVNIASRLDGVVHYLDTKGDFCAKRAHAILKGKRLDEEQEGLILDNIIVTRIGTLEELMNFLHRLKAESKKNKMKLVIIDSLPTIFFNFNAESFIFSNTSVLNHLANVLRCVANESNVPLVTINLITQWRESSELQTPASNNPLVCKPALGKYWASIPNTRLLVETLDLEKRRITLWKSSRLSSGQSCLLNITNSGVI